MFVDDDPILNLRNGIIEQAALDFKEGFSRPEDYHQDAHMYGRDLREETKAFFKGDWCALLLTGDGLPDGEALLERLQAQTLAELKERKELEDMKVELIQAPENPFKLIADIASICYDSVITNKKSLVWKLYVNGHHSVFEHINFTWKIENISRACSHQLVRHRHATITQRSQRYCEENGFDYVTPKSIAEIPEPRQKYYEQMDKINDLYCDLIHLTDIKREDARFLLPNACVTEMYFSCNLREFVHICNERLCSRAQWEIRELVQKMAETLPNELQFMFKPKCMSGYLICNEPCSGSGYRLLTEADKKEVTKK